MAEVLQANIFFLITGMAVIVFTIFLCVAMFYVIKILKAVRHIVDRIDSGSETIAEDIGELRKYVASGSLISQIVGLFFRKKAGTRRSKRTKDTE